MLLGKVITTLCFSCTDHIDKKNDQCYTEQKNFIHIRELFGWEKYGKKELVELMNDIYRNEWSLLHNLFYPQMKLQTKVRMGAKYKKTYSDPKISFESVLTQAFVSAETKARLIEHEKTINPKSKTLGKHLFVGKYAY